MIDVNERIVAGLEAAVLLADDGGEVVFASSRASAVLGRDLNGMQLARCSLDDELPLLVSVVDAYRRAVASPEPLGELLIATDREGPRYYWLSVTAAGEGGSAGRVLLLQDISAPLTESPALRRIFSQVSHDIRSPLTSIGGAAELLLSGRVGTLEGVQRRLLTIIEDGTRKISGILARTRSRLAEGQAKRHEVEAAGEGLE